MNDDFELVQVTTYDGQVYGVTDGLSRFVLRIAPNNWGIPPVKFITSRGYGEHGERVIDYRLEPRRFTIEHVATGCTREEMWQARERLINALRQNRGGPASFTFVRLDGTTRYLRVWNDGLPLAGPPYTTWDEWNLNTPIDFIAHDPIWYGASHTSFLGCTLVDEHYPAVPSLGVDLRNSATNYDLLSMPFTPDDDTIDTSFLWLQRVNAASGTLTLSIMADATYHAGLPYGTATDGESGLIGASTEYTQLEDARILVRLDKNTAAAAGNNFRFRKVDNNNYWRIFLGAAAYPQNILLDEVVAGVPTTRGTGVGAVLADDLIMVTMEDETIKVYVNDVLHITYALAANFKTATLCEARGANVWRDVGAYPFPTIPLQTATALESHAPSALGPVRFDFASPVTLAIGDTYHYVLSTDRAAHASNYVTWGGYYRKYLDGLEAMWRFEEATGATRDDAYDKNDMTDSGADDVEQVSGIVDYGAGYDPIGTQYLIRPSNRVFRMGDIDFMWLGWINYTGAGVAASRRVLRKVGASIDYRLRTRTNDLLRWEVTHDGAAIANVDSNSVLVNGTDYMVAAYHDAANNEIGVELNRSRNTAAHALGVYTGNDPFNFGDSSAAASTWKGWLDEFYLYKTLLTGPDLDWFYNGGSGREWSEISPYPERQIRAEVSGAYVRLPYDLAARSVSDCNVVPAAELVFPFTFPITFDVADFWGTFSLLAAAYAGNWQSHPTILVTGPCKAWRLYHNELGVEITYLGVLGLGDYVTLDLQDKTLINQDGVDAWNYLGPTSNLNGFVIAPDIANTIDVYAQGGEEGATSVTINYVDRYIGI